MVAIPNETFAEYVARKGINATLLKQVRTSLLHYKWALENDRPDTPAMMLGRAVHTCVFEPDKFPLEYAVYKGARRAGKDWDAFEAANAGRTILKVNEYDHCLAIRDAVRSHPLVKPYLREGKAEMSLTWKDEDFGFECKGRLDWATFVLCDLKTARDVAVHRFASNSYGLGYHLQGAFYVDGYEAVTGERLPFVILAVESNPPHDVAVYRLDDDLVEAGRAEYKGALNLIRIAMKTGVWPGRYTEEQTLRLPKWAASDVPANDSDIPFDDID